MTLRLLTAGESHGERLTVILDGVPAGLTVREDALARDLTRRQGGHGRGGRQLIEHDAAHIVAGVRGGLTLGSPITLEIANRDWENWRQVMAVDAAEVKRKPITRVRPGHADLAGMLKYGADDARDVLERASARETAARGVAWRSCCSGNSACRYAAIRAPSARSRPRYLHRFPGTRSNPRRSAPRTVL